MSNTHIETTEDQIAVCAYCIWDQEGRPEGRARDHWLQAETQIAASSLHEEATAGAPGTRKRRKKA